MIIAFHDNGKQLVLAIASYSCTAGLILEVGDGDCVCMCACVCGMVTKFRQHKELILALLPTWSPGKKNLVHFFEQ